MSKHSIRLAPLSEVYHHVVSVRIALALCVCIAVQSLAHPLACLFSLPAWEVHPHHIIMMTNTSLMLTLLWTHAVLLYPLTLPRPTAISYNYNQP